MSLGTDVFGRSLVVLSGKEIHEYALKDMPLITPEEVCHYLHHGYTTGSVALKVDTKRSDLDIVIDVKTLQAHLLPFATVDEEYVPECEQIQGDWCSVKANCDGRVINLIVCSDDVARCGWELATAGCEILNKYDDTGYFKKKANRVYYFTQFFQLSHGFMAE